MSKNEKSTFRQCIKNQIAIYCIVILIVQLFLLSCAESKACAAFSYTRDGNIIIGANTDSCEPVDGLITVNKRNICKSGASPSTTGVYAEWVSEYGSITFTYCGREIAQYGMNEAGLVITTVGLPGSVSPPPDERPPLDGNIWVQYLLDTCESIDEVIAAESDVLLVDDKDQYMMCDKKGHTMIVECRNGAILYYRDEDIPSQVLTNARYSDCLEHWRENRIPADDPYVSFRRFNIGSGILERTRLTSRDKPAEFGYTMLDAMSQDPCTQWNIVFDISDMTIYYRTKNAPQKKFIDMKKFDFSCETPMLEQNIHDNLGGDTTLRFTEYSPERNLNLLREAFRTFGIVRTEEQLHQIIDFFSTFKCTAE